MDGGDPGRHQELPLLHFDLTSGIASIAQVCTRATDAWHRRVQAGAYQAPAASDGVTYTVNVENAGLPGKGLAAEDVSIHFVVPAGTKVVRTTGEGYQGVRQDAELKASVAVWQARRLGPKDRQTYTLTLSRAATAADNVRGVIRWTKPTVKTGPSDSANIAPAPVAPATQ